MKTFNNIFNALMPLLAAGIIMNLAISARGCDTVDANDPIIRINDRLGRNSTYVVFYDRQGAEKVRLYRSTADKMATYCAGLDDCNTYADGVLDMTAYWLLEGSPILVDPSE